MGKTVRVEIPVAAKQKLLDGKTITFHLPPQSDQIEFVEISLKNEDVFDQIDEFFDKLLGKLTSRTPK